MAGWNRLQMRDGWMDVIEQNIYEYLNKIFMDF